MTSSTKTVAAERAPRPTTGSDSATSVLRRFRIVFNAVKAHFREVEKQAGLAGAQVWALSVIRSSPGVGVNDLAHAMDVHQSTASNLVRTLIEQELVVAKKSDADRRTVQLHILPGGTKILRRAPGPFTGVLPDALNKLDEQTLARLDRDLNKLIKVLHAGKRGSHIPLGQP